MRRIWTRIAQKIDALSLRERGIVFAMLALLLIVFFNWSLLDPQYAKQKQLAERIRQEQSRIAALQNEIQRKARSQRNDPDASAKARLQQLSAESIRMRSAMQDMQRGLVPADRMPALLRDILVQDGSLRLVSLKTLPASPLVDAAAASRRTNDDGQSSAAPAGAEKDGSTPSIYKHGVEVVLQGRYVDIVDYLARLETMPWQLFWSKAALEVDEYPTSTLTLTLFTLSLDKKWLNL